MNSRRGLQNESAITFSSDQNVLIQFNSANTKRSEFDLKRGETKAFSEKDLANVSKVEVIYLGS